MRSIWNRHWNWYELMICQHYFNICYLNFNMFYQCYMWLSFKVSKMLWLKPMLVETQLQLPWSSPGYARSPCLQCGHLPWYLQLGMAEINSEKAHVGKCSFVLPWCHHEKKMNISCCILPLDILRRATGPKKFWTPRHQRTLGQLAGMVTLHIEL